MQAVQQEVFAMSRHARIESIAHSIRARLTKQIPLRRGRRRVRTHSESAAAALSRGVLMGYHRECDLPTAAFLVGNVLGHACGKGQLKQPEFVAVIQNSAK